MNKPSYSNKMAVPAAKNKRVRSKRTASDAAVPLPPAKEEVYRIAHGSNVLYTSCMCIEAAKQRGYVHFKTTDVSVSLA